MTNRLNILRAHIDAALLVMPDAAERRCAYLHLYGVAQTCALIALRRGLDGELATMAGMLHDFYCYVHLDIPEHARKGAAYAREVLEKLDITSPEEADRICTAIHHHSDKGGQYDAFTEVLIDADVMQHCLYDATVPVRESERLRFAGLCVEFGLGCGTVG